jgi:hypothetical protein
MSVPTQPSRICATRSVKQPAPPTLTAVAPREISPPCAAPAICSSTRFTSINTTVDGSVSSSVADVGSQQQPTACCSVAVNSVVATVERFSNTMRTPHVGLFLGAILGFALIVEGFGEMLIVALFAALGWLIASVVSGTIDIGEVLSSQRDRSAGRR